MRIRDNGVGLPEDLNLLKTGSLGMTLIKGLTGQLKGTCDIDHGTGVTITITFLKENTTLTGTATT